MRRGGRRGRALLERMTPEHKFATAARLSGEVMAAFAEGALPLPAAAQVLADALRILASPAIKVRRPLCRFNAPHVLMAECKLQIF